MAFDGKLTVNGKKFDMLYSCNEFERDVDQKGRPASHVYGGKVTVIVESTDDTSLLESMFSEHKTISGNLVYKQGKEDAEMKKLEFKDGYIIKFKETFERKDRTPMTTEIAIAAKEFSCGNAVHKEEWPEG